MIDSENCRNNELNITEKPENDENEKENTDEDESENENENENNIFYKSNVSLKNKENVHVWEDEDDKDIIIDLSGENRLKKLRTNENEKEITGDIYEKRLREQFSSTYRNTQWANLDQYNERINKKSKIYNQDYDTDSDSEYENENDYEDDITKTTENYLYNNKNNHKNIQLPSDKINIQRLKDANETSRSHCSIQSIEFHNNNQLFLTAGYDKTLRLFNIDGTLNNLLQDVHFKNYPIHHATFLNEQNKVICVSNKNSFYIYDLTKGIVKNISQMLGRNKKIILHSCIISPNNKFILFLGNNGYMPLLDAKTYQWIHDFKINGHVKSACFSKDSQILYSTGTDGEIYKWDMKTKKCISRTIDEGSICTNIICTSNNGKYYATGSTSGVVNLYETDNDIKPIKSFMNLTTSISSINFNSTSEILVIASKYLKDSLKMIHIPSKTVFSNWPTNKTPLSYVTNTCFSPDSGYLAIGNDRGKVLLYSLRHYRN